MWRKAQHYHPGLNQNTDKRRAIHYPESDTDMLSVSGGFGGGTFRRPPYCRRSFGIPINSSPPTTDRARAYSGEFDDRPFVRVTRHTNPLFTAGLDRTFKTRKSQKVACSMADAEKSPEKTESMCALLDVTARTRQVRRHFLTSTHVTPTKNVISLFQHKADFTSSKSLARK